MATKECITDDLLCELAEDIETGEQMEILGRTLGFKPAAINRYAETNRLEGRVTCKGTRDMLFDWRQTVEPSNQHPRLKQALNDANLIMLAETYIKESQSAEDIYCQNISESLTVRQCREKLENRYLNDLCRIQMKPWDKTDYAEFKNMHTTVTLVKKDANGQDLAKKVELEGSVSEIFSTKVNDALPVRILISAPAGRGKTTAVAKMAYDWVKKKGGSALENLPLLFVVKIRKTSHHTSIGEAIISELLSDVDDLTPEGLESFIRRNQTMCHIILDGLDEYAGISSSNNIVSIIRWKEFPECRVLITTRPYLENYFNEGELLKVYTKMWIEGFSEESSRKYIDKFFTLRPEKTQNLKKYLSDQPLIGELVKSPLFCLMVCHLWSEGILNTKTTTQTELLDSVNIFLMHHANRRSQSERGITEEDLNLLIQKLGKVALAGLLDDSKKLVFTRHDFRRVPYIVDSACEIGILSKTTITASKLPRTHKPTSIAIEFYHKLVQEHSAGKYIAAKSKRRMLTCRTPYLDRVLHKITEHIGEYENLIRFTAGTDNNLGVQIMGALLENEHLDESERYRILLDCSSETAGNEGNVKSLISKCVNATAMLLKSPTLYTVVGMQNLPDELKRQVKKVKFIGSTFSGDLTCRLWSCLRTYTSLRTLIISDFSLSFPSSPPELPSVTKLSVEKVTSQSYEGLISSLPDLVNIDITFDNAEGDISRFTAGLRQTGEQDHTHIILRAPSSLPSERRHVSRETMRGLGLLIRQRFKNLKWIGLSGIIGLNEEDLVELLESSTSLASLAHLNLESHNSWSFNFYKSSSVQVTKCHLSPEMTTRMWSCLRSFTSLKHLTISDSSFGFSLSPPELPSITELSAIRVTSQCYEGLVSSLPGLIHIDITIDDADGDIAHIATGLRRTGGQKLIYIALRVLLSLPSEKSHVSRETMRGLGLLIKEHTKNLKQLWLERVKCTDEDDWVYLIDCCRYLETMEYVGIWHCGTMSNGRLHSHLKGLDTKSSNDFRVYLRNNDDSFDTTIYSITHID